MLEEREDDEGCLDRCCGLCGTCCKWCGSEMRLASARCLVLLFFLICLLYILAMFVSSDTINRRINCNTDDYRVDGDPVRPPMVKSAESLTADSFTEEYISLSDKVEMLGPGERLVNSFFNYFSKKTKPKAKKKILIAVVTTAKYLLTRAKGIYETWAQDVSAGNKLFFFVGEDCDTSDQSLSHLPIIKVSGVKDNVYPPQEKVFSVLSYIYHRFGDDFKWFVRADDDVYIRVQELEAMLDALDWRERLYIGHPGFGKEEDRKRLKLLAHENYCMGGPGVVFSGATLQALTVHLRRCLGAVASYNRKWGRDIGWYNEDVELGRCISRTIGINCVPLKKQPNLFYADYHGEALNYTTLWKKSAFIHALTVHAVKNPLNLLSIHHFYKTLEHRAMERQLLQTTTAMNSLCQRLPENLVPPASYHSDCAALRNSTAQPGSNR